MRTGVNFEVSQMIFADDLQVFSNGNEESLEGIRRVFYISRGCLGWRSLKIREEFTRIEFVLKGFKNCRSWGWMKDAYPLTYHCLITSSLGFQTIPVALH